jgi:hypothetical protein
MKKTWKTQVVAADVFICVAVDGTAESMGRFIANLVAGKLDIAVPSNPNLICSKVMHHIDHSTVARSFTDRLKVLWSTGVHEEEVLILYSDAVACMLKAATVLKVFHPNMIHFTCLAQGLRRVSEDVRAKLL